MTFQFLAGFWPSLPDTDGAAQRNRESGGRMFKGALFVLVVVVVVALLQQVSFEAASALAMGKALALSIAEKLYLLETFVMRHFLYVPLLAVPALLCAGTIVRGTNLLYSIHSQDSISPDDALRASQVHAACERACTSVLGFAIVLGLVEFASAVYRDYAGLSAEWGGLHYALAVPLLVIPMLDAARIANFVLAPQIRAFESPLAYPAAGLLKAIERQAAKQATVTPSEA